MLFVSLTDCLPEGILEVRELDGFIAGICMIRRMNGATWDWVVRTGCALSRVGDVLFWLVINLNILVSLASLMVVSGLLGPTGLGRSLLF